MKLPKNLFRLDVPTDHDDQFVSVQIVGCKAKDEPAYRRIGILIEDADGNGHPVVFDEKQADFLITALQFAQNRLKRQEHDKQKTNKKSRAAESNNRLE